MGAGAGVGAGAGAGAGAMLVELLPKKLERGKSAASLFGFCLLQLTIAGINTPYEAAILSFPVATVALTVSVDFLSTTIATFLLMFSSVNLYLSFLSYVVSW